MDTLTFECPLAGQTVSTGIVTNAETLCTVCNVNLLVSCSACGEEHVLKLNETQLGAGPLAGIQVSRRS